MAEPAALSSTAPVTVGQLNRYVRYLMEQDDILRSLSVRGEVCELSRSAAGHVYLSLKDSAAQVSCVMFRREASQQPEELAGLRTGVDVVVHGYLTVYEPRGTYQIYVERLQVLGDGAIFQRFERMKAKLEREGLFASERKRELPAFPRTLALVTSVGSQAYHDVLHRLRVQYPFVRVIESHISVQGDGAADEAVLALDVINRLTDADVIVLARGGGSPQDLASFNDERLARAIFASRVPVVTGIGHEQDVSIADLVADHHAATPSLAAASAVPDVRALADRAARLRADATYLVEDRLRATRRRWIDLNRSLLRGSPENRLRTQHQRADDLNRMQVRAIQTHLKQKRLRLAALATQLDALNPLAILSRGYAVLTDAETGRVVGTRSGAVAGRRLHAQVSDGNFTVRVEEG